MTSENAIQAGSKLAAVMNEASAVVRRLSKAMLSADDLSQIKERYTEIAKMLSKPEVIRGRPWHATTLDEAKAKFRAAWEAKR